MAELTCADDVDAEDVEAVADAPAADRATVAIPYGLPESTPDGAAKRHFAYTKVGILVHACTQKLHMTNLQ